MERFLPDSWVDWLLRPLLMADPAAWLYVEIQAPDLRFMALVLALAVLLAHPRTRARLQPLQWRALLGLGVCFYVWSWFSGNGRYFFWGLLVVGPLAVMAIRHLPATLAMRNTLLAGVLVLQGLVVWISYESNVWGIRTWGQGPGLALESHPLRQRPAVFLTLGTNSYSIVVPFMHPASRWASVSGQQELVPGMREHARLQELLDGPLPVMVMLHVTKHLLEEDGQPQPQTRELLTRLLQRKGLGLQPGPCELVRSIADGPDPGERQKLGSRSADFLFCPVERQPQAASPVAPELDEVFGNVERQCPRFFPPGQALTQVREDAIVRRYLQSETIILIVPSEGVFYKYFRALNHTRIGSIQEVREGRFAIDCRRLDGRYVPPWARD